jgi:hypothetical protein
MRTRIMTASVVALAVIALAIPASATGNGQCKKHCPEPPPEPIEQVRCDTSAALRIAERDLPLDPNTHEVVVEATNTNAAPSQRVQLVVTYEANRISAQPRVILARSLFGGDVVQVSFMVPRWRDVDGQVVATIDDLGCDDQHESVRIFG